MSGRAATEGRLARSLAEHGLEGARIAIVLGSGLAGFSRRLAAARSIPFAEIDGMPRSAVPGHAGRFVIGEVESLRVIVQEGRVHLYEGWSAKEVCASVRALAEIGCRCIVLTNAAGGIHRGWKPPLLMRITDHIDRQGATALERSETGCGSPYDLALGSALDHAAEDVRLPLECGVYAGLRGPSYETPAEVRMLAWMGADAVGMSTVCEAQAARASGAGVAAISCVTNLAAGIGESPLSHEEVLQVGTQAAEAIATLLARAIHGSRMRSPLGDRIPPHMAGDLAGLIDHTLLRPDATAADIDRLCEDAVRHRFAAVCVHGTWVRRCAEALVGARPIVCAVAGFPLGASVIEVKAHETGRALADGAREIDVVMNIGALKSGDTELVRREIREIVAVCRERGGRLKVILETALLTDPEKVTACRIAEEAGADFVKTSTGFARSGATIADVVLMRRTVGPTMGIKAAGGIRDERTARKMISAGATRIGSSVSVAIVGGAAG